MHKVVFEFRLSFSVSHPSSVCFIIHSGRRSQTADNKHKMKGGKNDLKMSTVHIKVRVCVVVSIPVLCRPTQDSWTPCEHLSPRNYFHANVLKGNKAEGMRLGVTGKVGMKCTWREKNATCKWNLKYISKQNRFFMRWLGGCAPRRGGAVINIHVFLPLKVMVLFKNHRSGEERRYGAFKKKQRQQPNHFRAGFFPLPLQLYKVWRSYNGDNVTFIGQPSRWQSADLWILRRQR